jgi:hypothetical protein
MLFIAAWKRRLERCEAPAMIEPTAEPMPPMALVAKPYDPNFDAKAALDPDWPLAEPGTHI